MANATATRELLRRWAEQVVEQAGELVERELLVAAPQGETGDTRRGVSVDPGGGLDRLTVVARSTSPHGDYVEEGTRPHLITPRNARVLRFQGGGRRISQAAPNSRIATRSGGVVFAAYVNHPGTPARPWFQPVIERWADFLQRAAASVTAR